MWFRNLTLFRLSNKSAQVLDDLETGLEKHRLRECGPLELATHGFVSPYGRDGETLVHRLADHTLVTCATESRLLPNSVVNDELAERLRRLRDERKRRVGSRERRELKEQVLSELLPRAFTHTNRVNAYFCRKSGWLVVDTSSRKAAEQVVHELRQALGSLPAVPMAPEQSPRILMTEWLISGKLPPGLVLADECELRDPTESGAVVRCRRQDLESEEIHAHLKSGKQVFQLGLVFDDRIEFVLGDDLTVRKLRFLDAVSDELDATDAESPIAEMDARFALMALELDRLLLKFEQCFGLSRPDNTRG